MVDYYSHYGLTNKERKMFSNRFNTKNDPLLEAVKGAMQDGDLRRQAVALVNEEFGVFNRNAVIREHLAEYDARIEEAYKCMKEGKPLSPKQKKMAALGGNPSKIDAPDLAKLRKGAKIDEKKGCMYEGKPNDGNLANNYPPYDKVTRGDVIAGRLGKDQMGGKRKVDEKKMWEDQEDSSSGLPPSAAATQAAKQTPTPKSTPAKTGNAAGSTLGNAIREAIGTAVAQKMKHRDFKETRHPNPGAVTKAPVPGVSIAEEDQIDEISKELAGRYIKKAPESYGNAIYNADQGWGKHADWGERTMKNREKGVSRAVDKITGSKDVKVHAKEEKKLAELKKPTPETAAKVVDRATNRDEWSAKAANRLYDRYKARYEPKKMEEAAYSAKAGRAGKDLGKPGKMFSKIAAKSGGGEKGERIAGAILKKIRAKHMKEDQSF